MNSHRVRITPHPGTMEVPASTGNMNSWIPLFLLLSLLGVTIDVTAQSRLGTIQNASHTFYLEANGSVRAWGYNNSGQLGVGNRSNVTRPELVLKGEYDGGRFLGDNPGNPIVRIAALYRHSLAVTASGTVYGWGANNTGELGTPIFGNRLTPIAIPRGEYQGTEYLGDNLLNRIISVGGSINTSLALAEDGTLYAFGRNDMGQLGIGSTQDRTTATRVRRGEYIGQTYLGDNPSNPVVAMVGGGFHALALTQDGSLYAWGSNSHGQLGTGDMTMRTLPTRVLAGDYEGATYLGGNDDNPIVAIGAGTYHSVVLLQDGTVMTWGENSEGNLGNGTTTISRTPVRVLGGEYEENEFLGGSPNNPVVKIASGMFNTVALMRDGSVYAWGRGVRGQLGNDMFQTSSLPVRVHKGEYDGRVYFGDNPSSPVTDIAAGEDHVMAVVADIEPYAWGANWRAQLCNGTADRSTPVRVNGFEYTERPPTTVLGFNGALIGERVRLDWSTNPEYGTEEFVIERRFANRPWDSAVATPAAGFSYGPRSYEVYDRPPARVGVDSIIYYRLKLIYTNGAEEVFDSVAITLPRPKPTATILEYFRGTPVSDSVHLEWMTLAEVESDSFVIERRYEGRAWQQIISRPGGGTTEEAKQYDAWDDLTGRLSTDTIVYYRLKQIETDDEVLLLDSIAVHPLPAMPATMLAFFNAQLTTPSTVELAWRTASEYRSSRFVLERRYENDPWDSLTAKNAQGTTTTPSDYGYTDDLDDRSPSDTKVSYRLKLVSVMGEVTLMDSVTLELSTSSAPIAGLPSMLRLGSPVPNPFSAASTLSFHLPARSMVRAEIIGSDGRSAGALLEGLLDAGNHQLLIDGTALTPGVYFVRLHAGDQVVQQQVVHLK